MSKEKFGYNLRRIRIDKGLTQKNVSERLGYESQSTLSEIEAGKKGLYADKIPLLADILQVDIEDLYKY